jgi:HSP20 family molecular chaperone IbpA
MTKYLTFRRERLFPTDLMFRNLFDTVSDFTTAVDAKIKYPLNIIEKSDGLEFQFAVIGINKEDIEIEVESGDTLRVTYNKPNIESEDIELNYIVKNIANRSFNLAWRISPKYNLSKLLAEMSDGLLIIKIPLVPEAPIQTINIK